MTEHMEEAERAAFEIGDRVEKFTGGYTGPGVVKAVLPRGQIVVAHRIAGGSGELLHIYAAAQLRPVETLADSEENEIILAMCRAHDSEEAAQKGEPSPWSVEDRDFDWEQERFFAMREAFDIAKMRLSPAPADKMREALEAARPWFLGCKDGRAKVLSAIDAALSSPASGEAERLSCHDCGLVYGAPGWADFVVPDDAWEQIVAAGRPANILCANCMVRRAETAGIECRGSFTSGPFADHEWTKEPTSTASPEREAGGLLDALVGLCERWLRVAENGGFSSDEHGQLEHLDVFTDTRRIVDYAVARRAAPSHPREEAKGEAVPVAWRIPSTNDSWNYTDQKIIREAWEARGLAPLIEPLYAAPVSAEAIRREERERCAKVAERRAEVAELRRDVTEHGAGRTSWGARRDAAIQIAAAIRALDTEEQS